MSMRVRYLGIYLCVCTCILRGPFGEVAAERGTRVHLIFSNHLDIGFHSGLPLTPGNDANVLSRYFKEYFPAAVQVAKSLKARGGFEKYRYLTHSFLVSLYLDCPETIGIYCPTPTEVADFEDAVRNGDIVWHALPHNLQAEFMDADMLDWAVQMTHALDKRFELPPKRTASQRDVPGLTRAAVPILAKAGVKGLSVGVNSGSAPPGVPKSTPFLWRDDASNTSIIAFWHPGGYSGSPVDHRTECVTAPGLEHVLCAAWRSDNEGPHSMDEVLEIYSVLHKEFEGAEIVASTFDEYLAELIAALPSLSLATVRNEIGDTWINGIASDPAKVAEYRALLRARRMSKDRWDDPAFLQFSKYLLKVSEHTWGVDTKEYPGDYILWRNLDFEMALKSRDTRFVTAIESWQRQRKYLAWAVDQLTSEWKESNFSSYFREYIHRSSLFNAKLSQLQKMSNEHSAGISAPLTKPLDAHSHAWSLKVDQDSGAIISLTRRHGARRCSKNNTCHGPAVHADVNWAGPNHQLARPLYSTYSESDYEIIWKEYSYRTNIPEWFYKDFGKPFSTTLGGARREDVTPTVTEISYNQQHLDSDSFHIIVKCTFPQALVLRAGAPATVYLEYRSPPDSDTLYINLIWENKTPTRLPEAFWLQWQPEPNAVDVNSWKMSKLGSAISPLEVIMNGSQSMHAVDDDGISVLSQDGTQQLRIRSLDAALVSPGRPNPFPSLVLAPDLTQGMSYCLHNNVWGTNYVMWWPYQPQDFGIQFRFEVDVDFVEDGGIPRLQQQ